MHPRIDGEPFHGAVPKRPSASEVSFTVWLRLAAREFLGHQDRDGQLLLCALVEESRRRFPGRDNPLFDVIQRELAPIAAQQGFRDAWVLLLQSVPDVRLAPREIMPSLQRGRKRSIAFGLLEDYWGFRQEKWLEFYELPLIPGPIQLQGMIDNITAWADIVIDLDKRLTKGKRNPGLAADFLAKNAPGMDEKLFLERYRHHKRRIVIRAIAQAADDGAFPFPL